jgi:hypothetical protein
MALPINLAEISSDAFNLRDMMDGVLERVRNVFQSYNVPLPSRQYWTVGQEPAIDCEQLVVSLIQMYLGAPGDEAATPQRCNVPRSATLHIQLSRQIPTVGPNGKPPSGDKIELASNITAIDAWILMQSINELDQWDDTGYGLGVIATLDVMGPEGGFQTASLNITMAVP